MQENISNENKKEFILPYLKEPNKVLSSDEGDPSDVDESKLIEKILRDDYNFFESEFESKHKEEIISRLIEVIKSWSQEIAIRVKKYPESMAPIYEAKLCTFGSYRLNVNTNDADIDAVCVVPNFINREEHFFVELYERLKNTQKITEITAVKNAVVPIIKLVFDCIHIDISYSQLNLEKIDDNLDFSDNNLLKDMDEKSYKSFNGRRVADLILKSVSNQDNFRLTLRCIKLWAKNKGINSNAMGYLGGVSWAILVAKICQLYPNYTASRLLEKFFQIYDSWEWDKTPIKIKEIQEEKNNSKSIDQWNEKDMGKNKMSVITPAFPCMNSSHNVTAVSLSVLKDFFREGYNMISKEIKPKKKSWKDLFAKLNFFSLFKTFIEVDIVSNESDAEFKSWAGFVESRIRKLTGNFEWRTIDYGYSSLSEIFDFHLYPNAYERKDRVYSSCKAFFIGVRLKENNKELVNQRYDFLTPVSKFANQISEDAFREDKGGVKPGSQINLRIYQVKKSELPETTLEGGNKRKDSEEEKNLKRKRMWNGGRSTYEAVNLKKINRGYEVIQNNHEENGKEEEDKNFVESILND